MKIMVVLDNPVRLMHAEDKTYWLCVDFKLYKRGWLKWIGLYYFPRQHRFPYPDELKSREDRMAAIMKLITEKCRELVKDWAKKEGPSSESVALDNLLNGKEFIFTLSEIENEGEKE